MTELSKAESHIVELEQWINDLQSGMYINCVYCGHQYGQKDKIPTSMAEVLKRHIEKCPKHPMSSLKQENEQLKKYGLELLKALKYVLHTKVPLVPISPSRDFHDEEIMDKIRDLITEVSGEPYCMPKYHPDLSQLVKESISEQD